MDQSIRKAKLSIQSHVNFTIEKKYFMKKLSQTANSSQKPRYRPYADLLIGWCGNDEIVTSKITF